jgi:galactonate dehydratase
MRVEELETFLVANPEPGFGGRYFIIVKLTTDDGIVGIGECYVATFAARTVKAMIADVAERHLIGREPHHVERTWRDVYGRGYNLRPDVSLMGVWSGLEMACWDIIGKAAGRPVYELLGGRVHESLRSYTYLYPSERWPDVYSDPRHAAERAAEMVGLGFTAVKFDPAGPYTVFDGHQPTMDVLERSEAMVMAVREAVGESADILFGTHGQFTASGAIRLARRIESYDPLWFEEPVPPDDVDGMAEVASRTTIPVATGERLTTKYEFERVLDARAAGILQPNLGRVGGLLEGKKIAGMAEARQVQLAPHLYSGPVLGAANIQLATCTPNFLILEGMERWDGFHAELLETPVRWEEGHVIPPTEPGLGVVLDEDVARSHPWDGDDLHLEMGTEKAD